MLCTVAIVLTFSRTGIVLLLLATLFSLDYKKIRYWGKANRKRFIFTVLEVLVVFGIIYIFRDTLISTFVSAMDRFDNLSGEASGLTHIRYYQRFGSIVSSQNLIYTIFGYGPSSSGYPYSFYYNSKLSLNYWTVESTWLAIFFSSGLVGTVSYMIWYFKEMTTKFIERKYVFALMIAIFFSGFLYRFLWSYQFVVLLMLLADRGQQKHPLRKV